MPVIVDENDILVGGHGVLVVAERMGYADVPVIRLNHLGEAEKKVLRIALNRCAELGQWDKNLLKVEFESLLIDPNLSVDFDLSLSGFAMPEIYRITDEGPGQDDADDLTEEPNGREQAVSRLGDTFLLEEHSITNGNACDAASYSALMGDEAGTVIGTITWMPRLRRAATLIAVAIAEREYSPSATATRTDWYSASWSITGLGTATFVVVVRSRPWRWR